MPVIGATFFRGFGPPQIRRFGIIQRGLAQRTKGRKTSYFDVIRRPGKRKAVVLGWPPQW
jgi:hypothetical protein